MSPTATPDRLRLLVGTGQQALAAARAEAVQSCARALPGAAVIGAPPPAHWPFLYPLVAELPPGPLIVVAEQVHLAFDHQQANHTRLVTTQAQYLFTEWEAALEAHGEACLVATVDRDIASRHADDIMKRRGVFARVAVDEVMSGTGVVRPGTDDRRSGAAAAGPLAASLWDAFRQADAPARLRRVLEVLDQGRTAPALVATASICQEVNDLESAARDLDEAIQLAPSWAAARFERGKVWLRLDNMEAAAEAFRAAANRLPAFGGAWGNLGATLGELNRPAEALAAFERLLALDPASSQAVNNVGVVSRELGRLAESEAAFRRVTELEPQLAFGHYNLGHTLFLQGRYHAAAAAYARGQSLDPARNPVQATRLAMCRLATGDGAGALAELQRATQVMSRESRKPLLADTSAILWALITQKPDLSGWQPVHDWLNGELAKLA